MTNIITQTAGLYGSTWTEDKEQSQAGERVTETLRS